MKILIFRIGALGDILMTTPFIKELGKQNPKSKIDYLTGKSNYILLKDNEFIDEVILMSDDLFFKYKIIDFLKLIFKIKKRKYDKIYILDKHWIFSVTAFLFGIKTRIGFKRDRLSNFFLTGGIIYGKEIKHEIIYNLELLGNSNADKNLYFNLQKDDEEFVLKYLQENKINDYIVFINDGGNNGFEVGGIRMLPDNKFSEILIRLSRKNKILLLGGPNMKNYYSNFVLNKNIINVAGLFKIPESIALLKYAKKVYSTDCGPLHMASCVNQNIICFFGPTNPKRKAPFVKNLITYWDDKLIYDENYEIFGKIPKNKFFFTNLDVNKIIQGKT